MQNAVKELFEELGILKYRLVCHDVEIEDYDVDKDFEIKNRFEFNYLFFEFNNNIYRLDYSGDDKEEIVKLINEVIEYNFIYCDSINLDIENVDYLYEYQRHKTIPKGSIKDIKKYQFCKTIKFCKFNWKMKVYTKKIYKERFFEESTLNIAVELGHGMPIKEISIYNPKDLKSIEYKLNNFINKVKASQNYGNEISCIEQKTGKCVFTPEITHLVLSFLCNALRGDQILFGCSFISSDDFNNKIIKEKLSLCKLEKRIDSEGSFASEKYYIKNGKLISGVNDIRTASYLGQTPGDTSLIAESRSSFINIDKVYVSPIENVVLDGVPIYDRFIGEQVFFNQLTGEIKFTIGNSDGRHFIHIEEDIISLINRIECSLYFDNEEQKYNGYEYGILVNLEKLQGGQ